MPFFSKTFSAETRSSYTLNTSCFNVSVEPFDKANYRSVVEVAELESLTVGLVHNVSSIVERKRDDTGDPHAKRFTLMHVIEGELMIASNLGTTMLTSGQFVLLDNSHARKLFVYKSVKVLLICVSRPVLQRYLPEPEDVLAQVLRVPATADGSPPFSPVLNLWEHFRGGKLEDFRAGIAEQLLRDISAVYTHQNSLRQRSRHALRLVAMIRQYVEGNLGNPQLNAETIAAEFRISARYMRSLFNGGERLPLYIQRRRIEESAKLLASPQHSASSIAEIARLVGFKSSTQFARCFRALFNETAREFRQRHLLLQEAADSRTKRSGIDL